MIVQRRFIFRGNASGVSAHIRRPEDQILYVQAASSLPVIGGVSKSSVGPQRLKDYLHFESAETSAEGLFIDPRQALAITHGDLPPDQAPTSTNVSVAVRGLNVGKMFAANSVQLGLVSHSPQSPKEQPSIKLENTSLEKLTFDGYPFEVELDNDYFCEHDTLEKLQADYGKNADKRNSFYSPPDSYSDQLYLNEGMAYATIVKDIKWPGGEPRGYRRLAVNAFYVEGFGAVYFGELLISALSRRLTMIRFQLGSDIGGELSVAEGETNGSHWPE